MNVIGRIYRIECLKTNRSYIGHTIRTLEDRMKEHENINNRYTSWIIIAEGNYQSSVLVEITEYEYEMHSDGKTVLQYLLSQEQLFMDIIPNIVNKNRAFLTDKEKAFYNQIYRANNRLRCWHYDNDGYICPCGGNILKNAPLKHMKGKKHNKFVSKPENRAIMYDFLKNNKWGTKETKVVSVGFPVSDLPPLFDFDQKKAYNINEIRKQLKKKFIDHNTFHYNNSYMSFSPSSFSCSSSQSEEEKKERIELLNIEIENKFMDTLKNDLLHQYIQRLIRYENGYRLMGGLKEYF